MAELLLVNPARKHHRRKRNPMPRALAHYWATHGRRRKKAHHASGAQRRRKSNPHRRHHMRRRRNPSLRGLGSKFTTTSVATLKQGVLGSIGALGNDLLMGQVFKLPLPTWLSAGTGAALLRAVGALGIGMLGSYVWRGRGRDLADGAMTVVLHDMLKSQLQPVLPTWLPMGEYLTFAPTVGYTSNGMGQYLTGAGAGMLGEYITGEMGNGDFYAQNAPGMTY